ncbi:LysM peptidoglycan-binding domain-containing protein [Iodobacter fluviatilis]|uniref:Peptidoglycan-binding protein LysM n=1 Tax=Iodobacter fluviatilis TaxID=537 RepID=A0A7G3G7A9_9NEIS|nr:LysM peptidoglycan-binding domain-containing protein [Iodobacter fluviatilis]QBC43008.1 peptidoglycan-binding protein LysM [Iodobacter fluviatilis]
MRKTIISLLWASVLLSGTALADSLAMQDNAPDRYVVVKGDTLWSISGHFLKTPWRWPEIWQLNKTEIKNPHWIYPGDVVLLDNSSGVPRLRLLKNEKTAGSNSASGKLSPSIRFTSLADGATPSIPMSAISPFLSKPLVIDNESFAAAPRIAAGPDERVIFASGDNVFAVGLEGEVGDNWQVFRDGKNLIDPDDPEKKRVIGHQVDYLGDARLEVTGDVATLRLTSSKEEILVGSRLIRANEAPFINYVPHVPELPVSGRIVTSYGGVAEAGPLTTVVINRGSQHGVDVGSVFFNYKAGRLIRKESSNEPDRFTPIEKNGNLFIYRVFPEFAYGLVLDSTRSVNVGDEVKTP